MCGRYTLTSFGELGKRFELAGAAGAGEEFAATLERLQLTPRYNIAPTQDCVVIAPVAVGRLGGGRELRLMRWGLIPAWAKDAAIGNKLINARSETAAEKPSFRSAFKTRRCLVPADGYYEWQAAPEGKLPWLIRAKDGAPLAFAGLYEHWRPAGGEPIESFTILTCAAHPELAWLHERMPVILTSAGAERWLDPATPLDELQALMQAYPANELTWQRVSRKLNNPRHEGPELLEDA